VARTLRWVTLGLGAFLALALVAGGIYAVTRSSDRTLSEEEVALVVTQSATSSTTSAPPTTTVAPRTPGVDEDNPPWATLPELGGGELRSGASGPEVQAYQERLRALRFDPGPIDGNFGQATVYAVQGLQKLFGMEPTGRIDENVRFALQFFQWPEPMHPGTEPTRTEVDLGRQVMVLWQDNKVELITTVSSGSGEHYCYVDERNPGVRVCEYADTYNGRYEYYRTYKGWEKSPLGRLYNPIYFNRGIAVHGYESVPTRPASHGCVRIPMHISEYYLDLVSVGEPVYVIGGRDDRRAVTYTPVPTTAPPAEEPAPEQPAPPTTAAPVTTAPAAAPATPAPPAAA